MNLPILERLGVLEQVRAIGVFKPGAEFPLQDDADSYQHVPLRTRASTPKFGYAYQVKREEFDQLLFQHAQANGVDAREVVTVERVELRRRRPPGDGACARRRRQRAARARCATSSMPAAATRFIGGKLKLKKKNPLHQSAAIFSHFTRRRRAARAPMPATSPSAFRARLDVADPAARAT